MTRCPFFEEVVVAFCRAYPVKKMVPSDRLQADCVCTAQGFETCGLFQEVMARIQAAEAEAKSPQEAGDGPEGSQGR